MSQQWVAYRQPLPRSLQEIGLGREPVFSQADNAWYARQGNQVFRYGLGAPVDDAAQAMLSYQCAPGASGIVRNFQAAYNSANNASLTIDGLYGQQTQQALQATLDQAGAGVAPPACYDASGNYIGPGGSSGSSGGGDTSSAGGGDTSSSSMSSFFTTYPYAKPILIGTAAIATGFIGYKLLSKHKRGRLLHHRRRH